MGGLARRAFALLAALCALAAGGCASTPGRNVTHVVRPGENLYRIARHYDVEVASLIRANGIRDVTALQVGQRLVVPGAHRSAPNRSLATASGSAGGTIPSRPQGPVGREVALREADLSFVWPIQAGVSSGFGWRSGQRHEGVDLPARKGTPVRAAEAGRVIHSSVLSDYGNVVILKHAGRYSTVYAHNRRNRVRTGQFVEKGDVIAEVGRSGNASGFHLHFEVRRDRVAHDPLRYLPSAHASR